MVLKFLINPGIFRVWISTQPQCNQVLTVYYYTPPPMFLACVRCSDSEARVNNRALEKTSRNWGEQRRSPQSSPLYFVLLTSFYSSWRPVTEQRYIILSKFASRVERVPGVNFTARQKHESAYIYITWLPVGSHSDVIDWEVTWCLLIRVASLCKLTGKKVYRACVTTYELVNHHVNHLFTFV